jgi:hypothetical protein
MHALRNTLVTTPRRSPIGSKVADHGRASMNGRHSAELAGRSELDVFKVRAVDPAGIRPLLASLLAQIGWDSSQRLELAAHPPETRAYPPRVYLQITHKFCGWFCGKGCTRPPQAPRRAPFVGLINFRAVAFRATQTRCYAGWRVGAGTLEFALTVVYNLRGLPRQRPDARRCVSVTPHGISDSPLKTLQLGAAPRQREGGNGE